MNDVQEVAVLRLRAAAVEIRESDWAIGCLLVCICSSRANWPNWLAQDPSLAHWIAGRLPREATLNDISASIDSMARQHPMHLLAASISSARVNHEVWLAFQQWWRHAAALARLVSEDLAEHKDETLRLIPTLCQLIGPAWLPRASAMAPPFELVASCDADRQVARAIEAAQLRLRDDSQLVQRCLSAEEHSRVDGASSPLHGLLPDLLRNLAELQDLRDRFDDRLQREKLLSMKELAYGASHEINNPLANISSRAQVLLRDESDPERRRSLATINSQAFRAHEMIADMMLFAKPPALSLSHLDAKQFLDSVVEQVGRELPDSIELHRDDAEAGPGGLVADPLQLTVAIQAICANAVEAMEGRGRLVIRLRSAPNDWKRPGAVAIEIEDDGPGIPPEVQRHLFDPFYSGREAGRGLGFGLSKAWRIVQLHGGQIFVDSQAGEGATFTISLPAGNKPADDT